MIDKLTPFITSQESILWAFSSASYQKNKLLNSHFEWLLYKYLWSVQDQSKPSIDNLTPVCVYVCMCVRGWQSKISKWLSINMYSSVGCLLNNKLMFKLFICN